MSKWWMKECPKCQGDLFEDKLMGDREITCLQCGYVLPTAEMSILSARSSAERRDAAARPGRVLSAA